MKVVLEKFTFRDFMLFNYENERIYELIYGRLVKMPPPVTEHQRISRKIEFRMIKFVEGRNLGEIFDAPIGVRFSDEIALQPDIIFISKERMHIIKEKYINGVPDLVVEIISKGTKKRDTKVKKAIYERFGVKEYWIVNPFDRSIEVYVLNEEGKYELYSKAKQKGKVRSSILEGFEIALKEVFCES